MKCERMWATIHSLIEQDKETVYLMSVDGSERLYAVLRHDPEDPLFYVGTTVSGTTFRGNQPFELMHTLFLATIGERGKELE